MASINKNIVKLLSVNNMVKQQHRFHFLINTGIYRSLIQFYNKKLSKIPAATAEPITPETLGAMACISRWLLGSFLSPSV